MDKSRYWVIADKKTHGPFIGRKTALTWARENIDEAFEIAGIKVLERRGLAGEFKDKRTWEAKR